MVIFGLAMSSSWGNGHATLWRGLCRALARHGHTVVFFERDVPYYAAHRDLTECAGTILHLYADWSEVLPLARRELSDADVGMITSYCPDALEATELTLSSRAVPVFYDLDTPVTLDRYEAGEPIFYLGPRLLRDFDLVLSYTGGRALTKLQTILGARLVFPLYGSVDPEVHYPVGGVDEYRSNLSYLGTYAQDRQSALQRLLIEPASRMPNRQFMIGGALYPQSFPWAPNIYYRQHVPPSDHPAFYCSSWMTLNITRHPMAQLGYCPSGRLFEAAACGVPILSDSWEGLEDFFSPGSEIIVGRSAEDAIDALNTPRSVLENIGRAARERTLAFHTAEMRARDLEAAFEAVL